MNNTHNLLENVLTVIENDLTDKVNPELIAGKFDISSRHLQRLFKLTFNQSLGLYIRSRKLAASIDDLLNTNIKILDIALDYGFEYEQSYIRSFRREYGITPGDLRKTGKILKTGIQNVYQQDMPALRFIGKKCIEKAEPQNILGLFDNWQQNNMFSDIEKQSDMNHETFFEGGDAYIGLVRKKDNDFLEYWMGMFMPKGTEVPHGFEALEFPEMSINVCSVYGKRSEVINYEVECRKRLAEAGLNLYKESTGHQWYFLRFNWRRFYVEDMYGKRVLDYCYPVIKHKRQRK